MTAGESAREVARRSRQRHGRDTTWARNFDRGADGEERTAAALTGLPAGDWTVVHDVRWPGRQRANLDHVVVGPGGVFVIDSKQWSGRVVTAGGELRQNGRRRTKAVEGAVAQADSLRSVVRDLDPRLVVPVLCLVGQGPVRDRLGEVLVASPETIVQVLTSGERVLPDPHRRRLAGRLQRELPSVVMPRPRGARRTRARDVVLPPPTMALRPPRQPRQARRPRRTRVRHGRGGWGGLAALLPVLGVLLALVVTTQTDLLQRLVDRGVQRQLGPTVAAPGEAAAVRGTSTVPDLRVTVNDVARAVPRAGPPPRGERLWAAYVVVRNTGDRAHRPPASYLPDLRDSAGMSYAATPVEVRRGRSLDPARTLRPGRAVEGYVVWSLPRGASPATVVLRGAARTVSWGPVAG
jgi:hypothetical protein